MPIPFSQEVIGSAIALKILIPGLSLWQGVLITAVDCFLLLLLSAIGIRKFEAFLTALIGAMLLCFVTDLGLGNPDGAALMEGWAKPYWTGNHVMQVG